MLISPFHPKSYIFEYEEDGDVFIGSSNKSSSALTTGIEWNKGLVVSATGIGKTYLAAFDSLDFSAVKIKRVIVP